MELSAVAGTSALERSVMEGEIENKVAAGEITAEAAGFARLILNDWDLPGGATWAPVRDQNRDWSRWGAWEVWRECKIAPFPSGAVGAQETGAFVAWDSRTKQQLGFDTQTKAEMFAVLQNDGKPTRIVAFDGSQVASGMSFLAVSARVAAEIKRMEA